LLAGDHPEQRRLAGSVGTDQADLLALLDRRRGLDEENLVAILLADVVETNHEPAGPGGKLRLIYAMQRADGSVLWAPSHRATMTADLLHIRSVLVCCT